MIHNFMFLTGFPPILPTQPKLLVLGSAPSVESLRQQKYYAHPRNAFWKIMEQTLDYPESQSYEKRIEMLIHHQIALWDVVGSAYREGSLDSNFDPKSLVLNPIGELLQTYPTIEKVLINGTFAYNTFKKNFGKEHWFINKANTFIKMPSTSPANASQNFNQKLENWQIQIYSVLGKSAFMP